MQTSRDYFIRKTLNGAIDSLRQMAHDIETDMDYFIRVRQYADGMYRAIRNNDITKALEYAEKYKEARFSTAKPKIDQ